MSVGRNHGGIKERNMDINDYKKLWKESEIRNEQLALENREIIDRIRNGKVTSSLDKLANSYKSFMFLGCALVLLMMSVYSLYKRGLLTNVLWPMILGYSLIFIGIFVDGYLYYKLKNMDVSVSGVKEISSTARKCRRIHLMSQVVLIPLAICYAISLGLVSTSAYFVYGIIAGALIGGVVGFTKWLDIMKSYKKIISEGRDLLGEE